MYGVSSCVVLQTCVPGCTNPAYGRSREHSAHQRSYPNPSGQRSSAALAGQRSRTLWRLIFTVPYREVHESGSFALIPDAKIVEIVAV
jgi:hypothetical protein